MALKVTGHSQVFLAIISLLLSNYKKMVEIQVFWLQNTAQPLRQDKFTYIYKDWRTYHRLILFDAIAAAVFKRLNVAIRYPKR